MESKEYLRMKIREEERWIYKNITSPKAIFLNIITLGFYGMGKCVEYGKRVGIL